MARPTKLNQAVQDAICELLEIGVYPETAAEANDISKATFYKWVARGDAERAHIDAGGKAHPAEAIYLGFRDSIKRAIALAEIRVFTTQSQGQPGWQSQSWILERRFPKRWAVKKEPDTASAGSLMKTLIEGIRNGG